MVLATLAIIYLAFFDYPSVLRTTIAPLNHVQVPLSEVLQGICRHVDRQDRHVWFVLHEEELKAKTITLRTERPMTLKQVLDRLTGSAGCSFHYRRCATCGAIPGPIKIYKHHRVPQSGERRLFIRHDGVREEGGGIDDNREGEGNGAKETAGEGHEPGQ